MADINDYICLSHMMPGYGAQRPRFRSASRHGKTAIQADFRIITPKFL